MNKCLRITVFGDYTDDLLTSFVQKIAHTFELEGTASAIDETQALIIVCGDKDKVDGFLDALHKGTTKWKPEDLEVEPFLKDKDYRGVFRVIK
ncbi:MAG: acylphosphatase [Candidatus Dependentiae bacterium]|nr:acylphosphatase [Candidatus Dependentiae bacterium]